MLFWRVVHKVHRTLIVDFLSEETEVYERTVKALFKESQHVHLYRHHAIQFTGCNKDILQLINIEKQVNVHIDRGYNVQMDLFNAGLKKRKEILEAEEETNLWN